MPSKGPEGLSPVGERGEERADENPIKTRVRELFTSETFLRRARRESEVDFSIKGRGSEEDRRGSKHLLKGHRHRKICSIFDVTGL